MYQLTTLDHERLDNAMESGAFIAKTFLACSQITVDVLAFDTVSSRGRLPYVVPKVLSGFGDGLAVEADDDAA